MKFLFISLAFGFSFLLFNSCHERGPLFPDPALGLGLRDFSCTEAWIELQVGNNDKTANIYIKKNDKIIQTIRLGQSDSLFYFDNLQPNTNYKFDAVTYDDGKEIKSNPVTFTTLDTTSHNFTWQTFEFGQHSSSTFYDVSIIDENNIWAVGEIYMNDSLGNPDPIAYNAVHWNGNDWELKRINMLSSCNPVTFPPLKAIWAFSENNIVFTSGGSIGWFDGTNNRTDCTIRPLLTGSINKLWGSSGVDLYVVGNNGNIAHNNGSSWTRIMSGTTLNINDIWGSYNNVTNKYEILAVASVSSSFERAILSIDPSTKKITQLSSQPIQYTLNGIWFKSGKHYYAIGDGIYEKSRLNDANWKNKPRDFTEYFTRNIRGNDINDLFIVGDFGEILHFNGSTWFTYNEHYMQGILFSVATKNNIVVTVGLNGSKATIIQGTRN